MICVVQRRKNLGLKASAVIKDTRSTVSAANRLTGDELDESSVGALIQRWHPLDVTQVTALKHFWCSAVKEQKKRKVL